MYCSKDNRIDASSLDKAMLSWVENTNIVSHQTKWANSHVIIFPKEFQENKFHMPN